MRILILTGMLVLLLILPACNRLEALDRDGCVADCKRQEMTFSRYVYKTDGCWCWDGAGEVKIY